MCDHILTILTMAIEGKHRFKFVSVPRKDKLPIRFFLFCVFLAAVHHGHHHLYSRYQQTISNNQAPTAPSRSSHPLDLIHEVQDRILSNVLQHYRVPHHLTLPKKSTQNSPPYVRHLAFLKVHKAASTTTQNIFLRYGFSRNLTFVLPPEFNRFGYPNIISITESLNRENVEPLPNNKTFDILCHHALYNRTAFSQYLHKDTLYIGTLRQPYSLFGSILNYIRPSYITNIQSKEKVSSFLRHPLKYEPLNVTWSFTNNRLSVAYGCPPVTIKARDMDAFLSYMKSLHRDFLLVIIAERYHESLVLLKRYLSWSFKDILYVRHNMGQSNKVYKLRPEDEPLYKLHAVFDYILYDFFNQRLQYQIDAEDKTFSDEVERFEKIREQVELFCHSEAKYIFVTIEENKWDAAFNVTREDCRLLHEDEIRFTQTIRERQYGVKPKWMFKI